MDDLCVIIIYMDSVCMRFSVCHIYTQRESETKTVRN